MNTHALRANIWKLYLFKTVRGFMLVMPTIVLFFQENGLSMTDVFLLQTIFSITIVVLEIPSGYFADRVGRKTSLVIGACMAFLGFVLYSFALGFWPILVAEIVLGIGFAFVSGADSALLYDTLAELGEVDTYKKREGNMLSIATFSEAIASTIGGFVALISLRAPIILEAIIFFFLIPLTLSLYEPTRRMLAPESKLWSMRSIIIHALNEHVILKWLIFYYAVISTFCLIIVWFRQAYLQEAQVPLEYFGFIWAALMLTVSFSSFVAHRFEKMIGAFFSLVFLLCASALGFFILGSAITVWFVPALFLFAIVRGFQEPLMKDYIQHHVSSDIRATCFP